jgi:hypothetical protein
LQGFFIKKEEKRGKMNDWVPIQGFSAYSVNNLGQVRRDSFDRLVIPHSNQTESIYVSLMREGIQCQRALAPIVAKAFLDSPVPPFDTPINLDGDRWNCAADNLMWRPRWFAIQYHQQFKNPYYSPVLDPVKARGEREVFSNSFAAAIRYGLLERDVVMSIYNNTYAWPNYMIFELVP